MQCAQLVVYAVISENWKCRQYNASDPDLLGELSSLFLMMVTVTAISMVVAKYEIALSVFFFFLFIFPPAKKRDNKRYNSTIHNFPTHFRRCRRFIPHGYRFVVSFSFLQSLTRLGRSIDRSFRLTREYSIERHLFASTHLFTLLREIIGSTSHSRSFFSISRGNLRDDICVENYYKSSSS